MLLLLRIPMTGFTHRLSLSDEVMRVATGVGFGPTYVSAYVRQWCNSRRQRAAQFGESQERTSSHTPVATPLPHLVVSQESANSGQQRADVNVQN